MIRQRARRWTHRYTGRRTQVIRRLYNGNRVNLTAIRRARYQRHRRRRGVRPRRGG